MAETGTGASRSADAGRGAAARSLRSWIVSAGLVIATVLLAVLCIFILSSVLAQTRLSSITIDGVSLSVRRLVSVGSQWKTVREQIESELQLRNKARTGRIDLNTRVIAAANDSVLKTERLTHALERFHRRADAIEPPVAAVNGKDFPDQVGVIQEAQPQIHKDHPELDATVDEIFKAYGDYMAALGAGQSAQAQLKAADQAIKDLSDSIESDNKNLNSLFDLVKTDIDPGSRQRIENALYELFFD